MSENPSIPLLAEAAWRAGMDRAKWAETYGPEILAELGRRSEAIQKASSIVHRLGRIFELVLGFNRQLVVMAEQLEAEWPLAGDGTKPSVRARISRLSAARAYRMRVEEGRMMFMGALDVILQQAPDAPAPASPEAVQAEIAAGLTSLLGEIPIAARPALARVISNLGTVPGSAAAKPVCEAGHTSRMPPGFCVACDRGNPDALAYQLRHLGEAVSEELRVDSTAAPAAGPRAVPAAEVADREPVP